MEKLIILKYQAKTIENALRLAMNVLNSRNKETETAMDRELIKADEFIKEVLNKNKSADISESDIESLANETISQCKDETYDNCRNASNNLEGDFGTWNNWKQVLVDFGKKLINK